MRRLPFLLLSIVGAFVVAAASPLSGASPVASVEPPVTWSGLAWSAPIPGPDGDMRAMLQVDGSFVAVGTTNDGIHDQAAAWRSEDGLAWQSVPITGRPDADSSVMWLVPIPGGLLAMGTSGERRCSGDGEGSTCDPLPSAAWMSTNGQTWLRVPTPRVFDGPLVTISGMAAGPDGLLAIGDAGFHRPCIWRSADGVDWERVPVPRDAFRGADLMDVERTPAGWVVVGAIGGKRIAAGGVRAFNGSRGAAWTSPDGSTWTAAHVAGRGPQVELRTIYRGADGLLALGSREGGQVGTVWHSADGQDWSVLAAPDAEHPIFPMASDGQRILGDASATGDHVAFFISTGGLDWQPLTAEGATATVPMWSGGPDVATLDSMTLLPDGLLAFGERDGQSLVWRATAMR